jgi:hypothetical protein
MFWVVIALRDLPNGVFVGYCSMQTMVTAPHWSATRPAEANKLSRFRSILCRIDSNLRESGNR